MLPHLDDYLLNLQVNNYSQETVYNYERDLKVFDKFLTESNIEFEKTDKKTEALLSGYGPLQLSYRVGKR